MTACQSLTGLLLEGELELPDNAYLQPQPNTDPPLETMPQPMPVMQIMDLLPPSEKESQTTDSYERVVFDEEDDFLDAKYKWMLKMPCYFTDFQKISIEFENHWTLEVDIRLPGLFGLRQLHLQLTYALNKMMTKYFGFPKKRIFYCHFEILRTEGLSILPSGALSNYIGRLPRFTVRMKSQPMVLVFKPEHQLVDPKFFVYFKTFTTGGLTAGSCGQKLKVLEDFIFLQCTSDLNPFGLCFAWGGLISYSGPVGDNTSQSGWITISEENTILLQQTKKTNIYAIRLYWNGDFSSYRPVKKYIKCAFKHFPEMSIDETLSGLPFKVSSYIAAGPNVRFLNAHNQAIDYRNVDNSIIFTALCLA